MSFILGLILSFPIIFQSLHAIEHHILIDDISCCSLHKEEPVDHQNKTLPNIDSEEEFCPILEYQLIYFLNAKQVLPEQTFVFVYNYKTPILGHPVVEYRDCKNRLRGPPVV